MTDNALQVFSYKEKEVRTTSIDGEVWFVAKDVCDILELSDVSMTTRTLDEDEKGTSKICTPGGIQDMTVVNEAGLYSIILRSNKPEAKAFSRWVRHEVLPSIRKTGSFSLHKENPALPSGVLDGAKLIFEVAGIKDNQLALALDRVYSSYTGKSALAAGNISLKAPTPHQTLTPSEIGAYFGIKAHRVNEILAGAGYQHKISGRWEALEPGERFAVMVDVGKRHGNGTAIRQLRWDSAILDDFKNFI